MRGCLEKFRAETSLLDLTFVDVSNLNHLSHPGLSCIRVVDNYYERVGGKGTLSFVDCWFIAKVDGQKVISA